MIRLVELEIAEFRGIRHLTIPIGGASVLIHGPNGSGKSGVVDAIDFALTGSVTRLTGEGTAGVSVKDHGPHVLQRDNPDRARVTLTFETDTGEQGTLTRTVRRPGEYLLEPDTPAMHAAVAAAAEHTELILTRREILKFILAKPGDRSQTVQALLKLDSLEALRQSLGTVKRQLAKERSAAEAAAKAALPDVAGLLGATTATRAEVTAAANNRRRLLNLPELAEKNLIAGPDWIALDDGVNRDTKGSDRAGAVRAAEELTATTSGVTTRTGELVAELTTAFRELGDITAAQHALAQRSLIIAALGQVSSNQCPVCDRDWESEDALRQHLTTKVAASEHAGAVQNTIAGISGKLTVQLETLQRKVLAAADTAETLLGTTQHPETLRAWAAHLVATRHKLSQDHAATVAGDGVEITLMIGATARTKAAAAALAAAAEALPDQSEIQAASGWLARMQERWARLDQAQSEQLNANERARVADALYATYCTSMDGALDALYRSIEQQFSAHYQQMNAGDEDTFRAELAPTAGKLDLTVGFYDLGLFPPGAYHSEGHQDGMGLALYLALLDHMLGADLSFVVLDDVITSIDIAHRRKICDLLLDKFPHVQFVITTHERTWAKTIEQLKVVKRENVVEFQSWSVETGPIRSEQGDVFAQIDKHLANNQVNLAAPALRQLLENRMHTLADDWRAPVAFRADGRHELGEMLAAVGSRYTRLLDKAKKSAKRWGDTDQTAKVEALDAAWKQARRGYDVEQWAINAMTHYNPSIDMTANEFAETVAAARELLGIFECSQCGHLVRTEGYPDTTTLRCRCAKINLNLVEK
jgi:recombinational DNA repair ATPase RecF